MKRSSNAVCRQPRIRDRRLISGRIPIVVAVRCGFSQIDVRVPYFERDKQIMNLLSSLLRPGVAQFLNIVFGNVEYACT